MGEGSIEIMIRAADLVGVAANAILGGRLGRDQGFDFIGVMALSVLSALGGGIIRDVLLQSGPPIALTDPLYLLLALSGAVVSLLIPAQQRAWKIAFPYLDAIALGSWAAAGASKAYGLDFAFVPSVMMGMVTAVGGGVLRDLVLRRTPVVFGGNTLYATSAVVASIVMLVLWPLQIEPFATVIAITVGAGLTLVSRWRHWRLPYKGKPK